VVPEVVATVCDSADVGDKTSLSLRPVHDAKPLDNETVERIGRIARADVVELRDDGAAVFGFDRAHDVEAVRGHLEMASRIELGAHWHTRYELVDG
jgi:methyl coenzyme M reductase gamma subunit